MVLINIIREKVIYLLILTITFTCWLLFHYDYIQVDFQSILLIISPFVVVGIIVLISNLIIRGIDIPSEVKYKIIFGFYYHEDRSEYQRFVNNLMSKYDNEFRDHIKTRRFLGFTSASFIVFMMCYVIGPVLGFIKLFALAIEEYYFLNQVILIAFAVLLIVIGISVFNLLFPKFVHANAWSIVNNINGLYFRSNPNATEENYLIEEFTEDTNNCPEVGLKVDFRKEKQSFIEKGVNNDKSNVKLDEEMPLIKLDFEYLFDTIYKPYIPLFIQIFIQLGYANDKEWIKSKFYIARIVFEELRSFGVMKNVGYSIATTCFKSKFENLKDLYTILGNKKEVENLRKALIKTFREVDVPLVKAIKHQLELDDTQNKRKF